MLHAFYISICIREGIESSLFELIYFDSCFLQRKNLKNINIKSSLILDFKCFIREITKDFAHRQLWTIYLKDVLEPPRNIVYLLDRALKKYLPVTHSFKSHRSHRYNLLS